MKTSTTGDPWRDKTNAIAEMEDDWQHWASVVCDPATPAQTLMEIVQTLTPPVTPQTIRIGRTHAGDGVSLGGRRVLETVAAHPNAPPQLLARLLNHEEDAARGFCRNPAAPFLLLEAPDFIETAWHEGMVSHWGQIALLRQSALPPIFAQLIANTSQAFIASEDFTNDTNAPIGKVAEAARLHIAVAGELSPEGEAWQNALRAQWKSACANAEGNDRDEAAELVEIGLAPPWAVAAREDAVSVPTGRETPPTATPFAGYPFLRAWFRYECAEGSPEEAAMLQQIGPDVRDRAAFVRALRASGTDDDLAFVAKTEPSGRGLIPQALIRHPNVGERALQALAVRAGGVSSYSGVSPYEILGHEKAGAALVVKLMEHDSPGVRGAARRHKNAPQDGGKTARRLFARRAYSKNAGLSPFASFLASLCYPTRAKPARLLSRAESLRWTERMEAVFIASAKPDLLRADPAGRTCADLLHHLSHDGNRLVRAAARAYIADPKLRFVL